MMHVWAIRQKSTGYFLPQLKAGTGGSWLEPLPDCLPRLFTSKRNAGLALSRWLEGHYKMVTATRSPYDYDETKLTVDPVEGRNKGDMELVELKLVEVLK